MNRKKFKVYSVDLPFEGNSTLTSMDMKDIEKLKQVSRETGISIRRLCAIFVKKGLKNFDKSTLFKD